MLHFGTQLSLDTPRLSTVHYSHLPTDSLYHARTAPTSKLTTPFIKAQAARLEALGWNNMKHAYSLILIAIVNDFLKTDRGRVNVMTAFSGAPLMNIRVFRVLQPRVTLIVPLRLP